MRAAVVFAHPHPQFGGTMHTKAVYQGAKGLTRIGCAVLRFNFRGVGRSAGPFDQGEGEKADFTAALDYMARAVSGRTALGGGLFVRRLGRARGRRGRRSRVGAHRHRAARRDVDLGQKYTFESTLASTKPKFFVQGEADEVCPLEEMWEFYAQLQEPKELVVIDGADHCSRARRRSRRSARGLLGDFEIG